MRVNARTTERVVYACAVLMALAVLVLAWPRLLASLRFLPVDIAIGRYYETLEIPTNRLLTLLEFSEEALDMHDHYRYHDGKSLVHYLRGLDIYTPALERRGEYRKAEQAALEVVRRAPLQPEAWNRIARVRAVLRDEPEDVLQAWKMSVFSGRTQSMLVVPRVVLGLSYIDEMDAEERAMLRDQLQLAWSMKQRELASALKRRDPALVATGKLLDGRNPQFLVELEEQLEKAR